jgi:hypothetical protein
VIESGRCENKRGKPFARGPASAPIIAAACAFALLLILRPSEAQVTRENSCYTCHVRLGGKMKDAAVGWDLGIHSKVGANCDSCHGGNSFISTEDSMNEEYGFKGSFSPIESLKLCASCHSDVNLMRQYNLRTDQYDEYKTSEHGKLLEAGDNNVATCISCHGIHEIRQKNDPRSTVFHTNVPDTCAKCHGDKKLMGGYGKPHDQYEIYRKGYHGKILYGEIEGKNPMIVPNCATCHGIHGARPPGVDEVGNVCGNCHTNIYRYFSLGPHAAAVGYTGEPRCVDCHGNHSNVYPSLELFNGTEPGKCGFCHEEEGQEYLMGQEIRQRLEELKRSLDDIVLRAKEARESGRSPERLNNAVSSLRASYIQAIPVTHAVDFDILRPLFSDARDQIKIAHEEFDTIGAEKKMRKRVATIAVTLLLTIAALLMIKLWRLNGEEG